MHNKCFDHNNIDSSNCIFKLFNLKNAIETVREDYPSASRRIGFKKSNLDKQLNVMIEFAIESTKEKPKIIGDEIYFPLSASLIGNLLPTTVGSSQKSVQTKCKELCILGFIKEVSDDELIKHFPEEYTYWNRRKLIGHNDREDNFRISWYSIRTDISFTQMIRTAEKTAQYRKQKGYRRGSSHAAIQANEGREKAKEIFPQSTTKPNKKYENLPKEMIRISGMLLQKDGCFTYQTFEEAFFKDKKACLTLCGAAKTGYRVETLRQFMPVVLHRWDLQGDIINNEYRNHFSVLQDIKRGTKVFVPRSLNALLGTVPAKKRNRSKKRVRFSYSLQTQIKKYRTQYTETQEVFLNTG